MSVDGHRTLAIEAFGEALTAAGVQPGRAQSLAARMVDTVAEHTIETWRDLVRAEEKLEEKQTKSG